MKADKAKVTSLLKIAKGQIDGIIKMVDDDKYCIDISNQIMASEAILKKVNRQIISAHMESCIKEAFESGNDRDIQQKIDEILNIIDKLSN